MLWVSEDTQDLKQLWVCERVWELLKMDSMHFVLWHGYKTVEAKEWNVVIWMNAPPPRTSRLLNTWFPVDDTIWGNSGGVALLEEVHHGMRTCGFKAFRHAFLLKLPRASFYQIGPHNFLLLNNKTFPCSAPWVWPVSPAPWWPWGHPSQFYHLSRKAATPSIESTPDPMEDTWGQLVKDSPALLCQSLILTINRFLRQARKT